GVFGGPLANLPFGGGVARVEREVAEGIAVLVHQDHVVLDDVNVKWHRWFSGLVGLQVARGNLGVENPQLTLLVAMQVGGVAVRDFDSIHPAVVVIRFANNAAADVHAFADVEGHRGSDGK